MLKINDSITKQWRDAEKKEMGAVKYYAKYYGIPLAIKTAEYWVLIQILKVIIKSII